MGKIVECVPNFSEGRNRNAIDAIAASVSGTPGVSLLSVEPDADYNRTVVTFVGAPEAVGEAAFAATKKAAELIDMAAHKGEHPRLGAVDVVPFVPVAGATTEECIALSKAYGRRVASELRIPVYLYEDAATDPARKNLAAIRKGEYESLESKLTDPAWKPDFPAPYNRRSGATVTGSRFFLIAYNVTLKSNDREMAHEIALRIRESGRTTTNAAGEKVKVPGTLREVKAMGVLLERHDVAQVSINLTRYSVTPPHAAFEEVKKQAAALGGTVIGSEIVGLAPKEALLMAGRFYSGSGTPSAKASERELIALAAERLGLGHLEPFLPGKKIIEYMINQP